MKLVVFGLSITSSWGNGHATLWRGLARALAVRGHEVLFFEKDVPYYAAHRDAPTVPGALVHLYRDWTEARPLALSALDDAQAAIVTSFCPDGIAASRLVLESGAAVKVFYDLDTPVTLEKLARGEAVPYLLPEGLGAFDLVLSYTGGRSLGELERRLGARRTAPLYGSADPSVHFPTEPREDLRADLSYLGTYAADRQPALETFFLEPARRRPGLRFLIGGSMYPEDFPWRENVFFVPHVPPRDHPAFYSGSRLTLSVTRRAMAEMGFAPSGRLFEAAACGTVVLTDEWPGLEEFFEPGSEILVVRSTEDVLAALDRTVEELDAIAFAARERFLRDHTAAARAARLEDLIAKEKTACGA